MAKCAFCKSTILFGGVAHDGLTFCNDQCLHQGVSTQLEQVAHQVPGEVLQKHVAEVHQGPCPKCGGPGPIDIHTSHTVWSALVMTQWKSHPEVCCRSCGVKAKLASAASSLLLGWWGFPWGLVLTPVQVGRNLFGLISGPNPSSPSPEFQRIIRLQVASRLLETVQASQHPQRTPPE